MEGRRVRVQKRRTTIILVPFLDENIITSNYLVMKTKIMMDFSGENNDLIYRLEILWRHML
jgi:hypothetical protein